VCLLLQMAVVESGGGVKDVVSCCWTAVAGVADKMRMVCSLGSQRVTAEQPGDLLSSFADPHHFHDIIPKLTKMLIQILTFALPAHKTEFFYVQLLSMYSTGTAVQSISILKKRQTSKVWLYCHEQQVREN
jgi:hypothetical protein